MHRSSLLIASLLAALVTGCSTEPPSPTEGDAVPERLVTADRMLREWAREGSWLVSEELTAPTGATRVGLLLSTAEPELATPVLEARGIDEDGEPGEWVRAEVTFEDGTQRVARADLGMTARGAQIRLRESHADAIADIMWSAVVPMPVTATELATRDVEVAGRREPLRGELAGLVNDRSSWGARGTRCSTRDDSKYRMAIHHTVTPATSDPPTRLRGIQAYHMDTRGWCDIGYHFLVSLDGRLWEGRELRFLGTHVGGNNSGNIGISFIGCFHSSGCNDWTPFTPPSEMVGSAATLVGELGGLYGIDTSTSAVKGHRDHSGATTSCPGDNLHALLGDIRSGASTPPDYAAEFVEQSFPLARDPYPVNAGTEDSGYIELRNVGAATWRPGETFLGTTEPRDGDSSLAASDWVSTHRVATVDAETPPGETGRFVFSVRAPDAPGDYPQYFNLVQEGVAWFSDTGQGGPPDDQLQVKVTSMAWDAGPMDPDAGSVTPDAGTTVRPDASSAMADGGTGDPGLTDESRLQGGCGCHTPGRSSGDGWPVVLATLVLWMARRRGILAGWRR